MPGGAMIALVFALATNAFARWNAAGLAQRMRNAPPVTRAGAPELCAMLGGLARNAGIRPRRSI